MQPKLSIVIVSWNVREKLQANLARLASLRDELPFEVFVIDNASADGSARMVREQFAWVQLIMNDWNAGFAYGCNQGIRYSTGDVILLLNPDMLVQPGTLKRTYDELMEDRSIGVLGVKLKQDGSHIASVRRDPGFADQFAILCKLPHVRKTIPAVDRYLATDMNYGRTQDVEQVRGAYFAFRRDIVDAIGLLDERFFLWFEEVDYCKRVREAGYRVRYLADVHCEDFVGQSFAQVSTGKKQKILTRSMAQYFGKHHPWWQAGLIWAVRPVAIGLGYAHDAINTVKKS